MGCDIHGTIEIKDGDEWVVVSILGGFHKPAYGDYEWCDHVARSRNYRRFAALAGVRGEGPEPRGVPDDAAQTTRWMIAKDGPDGHSHSWLPLADAVRIYSETEQWPREGKMTDWGKKYPASLFFGVDADDLAPYRFVFWFDN